MSHYNRFMHWDNSAFPKFAERFTGPLSAIPSATFDDKSDRREGKEEEEDARMPIADIIDTPRRRTSIRQGRGNRNGQN